jgi:hypothetical protein
MPMQLKKLAIQLIIFVLIKDLKQRRAIRVVSIVPEVMVIVEVVVTLVLKVVNLVMLEVNKYELVIVLLGRKEL